MDASAAGSSSGGSASTLMVPTAGPDPCVDPDASSAGGGSGATAGGYHWQNAVILGGGFVSGIEFSPVQADIIYARTDVGGAYRWDATAMRWTPLTDWVGADNANLTGIESIAPDPVDANGVYAAVGAYTSTAGFILHSIDGGSTWTQNAIPVAMGGNADGRDVGERLAVDPNLHTTLYFAARNTSNGNGLWVSNDSAKTWARVASFPDTGLTTYGLSFVFFDKRSGSQGAGSSTIYVGVAPGAPPAMSQNGAPPPSSQKGPGLYRSTDGGVTWAAVPNDPGASISQYPHHAAMNVATGAIYFTYSNYSGPNSASAGGVWKLDPANGTSNDTWTNVTPPAMGKMGGGFGGVSVDANSPNTLVVSTLDRWPDEIYRSVNGGVTWSVIGSAGSHDVNGAQWLYWGTGSLNAWNGWMGDIEIDPFNSSRVLYNTGQGIWWSDDVTSQSIHWKFQDQGLEETVALGLISPSGGTAHLLSAVGDLGGFWHSDLQVSSSQGLFSNPVFGNTTSLDFAEQHPGLVVRVGTNTSNGTTSKHGSLSVTGGSTWVPFSTEPNGSGSAGSIAVSADGSAIVWAPQPTRGTTNMPSSTPAVSFDLGVTWTSCSGLPAGAKVAADRVNPKKFYSASGTQLLASIDGGATFAATGASLPRGSTIRPVMPYAGASGEGDLWIAGSNGLFHSTDGGGTVSQVHGVQSAATVGFGRGATCAAYPVIYLAGHVNGVSGIYRSDDQGMTFTRIDDPQHQFGSISYLAGDPRVYGRVYLGSGGRGILYGDPQ